VAVAGLRSARTGTRALSQEPQPAGAIRAPDFRRVRSVQATASVDPNAEGWR